MLKHVVIKKTITWKIFHSSTRIQFFFIFQYFISFYPSFSYTCMLRDRRQFFTCSNDNVSSHAIIKAVNTFRHSKLSYRTERNTKYTRTFVTIETFKVSQVKVPLLTVLPNHAREIVQFSVAIK